MLSRLVQMNGLVVRPDELQILQGVFEDVCMMKGVEHDSAAASDAAAFLISIYQSGVTDEGRLRRVIGLQS
jgi:hypothetical protein